MCYSAIANDQEALAVAHQPIDHRARLVVIPLLPTVDISAQAHFMSEATLTLYKLTELITEGSLRQQV
jgi:hypothetical protein